MEHASPSMNSTTRSVLGLSPSSQYNDSTISHIGSLNGVYRRDAPFLLSQNPSSGVILSRKGKEGGSL